jgi:hypothetical protein
MTLGGMNEFVLTISRNLLVPEESYETPQAVCSVNTVKTVNEKAHLKCARAHQRNTEVAALQNKIYEENNKDIMKRRY